MRVCIVYDCLYPHTIGGAERWYRNLAERLASAGHTVTYLTLRQWGRDEEPHVPGVRVLAVGPRMSLYTAGGRRRVLPPLVFGIGVLLHLLRSRGRYDVVHTASFPYFSLLAAGVVRRWAGFRLLVDWHEVWTRTYWEEYLGFAAGRLGWWIQTRCLRRPQRAFCFSKLHERRLRELGLRGELTRLEGQYDGPIADEPRPARPVVVFVGRLIPEKRAALLPAAIARACERIPELRGEIYGDGPEREFVLRAIAEAGGVSAPGFVASDVLDEARATALCLVLPSAREGYGLAVLEAMAAGVPAVVTAGPDNAAAELVEEDVNGVLAPGAAADELANAIVRVQDAGPELRRSTLDWFRRNAERLSLERSLERVLEAYGSG